MIIVTGGAGFIGSNLIHELNRAGERDILLVDNFAPAPNLTGPKFLNLAGGEFADYMDKREFRAALKAGEFESVKVRAILHQGACSNTLEDDGRYMMDNNFTYSKELLHFALGRKIPLVYASTAAVYGASTEFKEMRANERPLNVYGYSKLVFDNYVRRLMPEIEEYGGGAAVLQCVWTSRAAQGADGERDPPLYSAVEGHRDNQDVCGIGWVWQMESSGGTLCLSKDLARINMFFGGLLPDSPKKPVQAVVNAGTGEARTFKAVAEALMQVHGPGKIEFIPFPGDLKNRYQHYTQADLAGLRAAGYSGAFTALEDGVKQTFAEEPAR